MSFFNMEYISPLGLAYRPLLGKMVYNKKSVEDNMKKAEAAIAVVEEHLLHNTFLVGERITLADLFGVAMCCRGFEFFYGKDWRQEHPNVTRWFQTISAQPIFADVAPKLTLLDTPALTNVPPKTEKKEKKKEAAPAPKKEKKEPAPKAEDEPAPAPKPKHPCEALGKASVPLDELKRVYSNEETPDALKWFWEHMNFEEYSLWKMTFKYNEELTLPFMSNNQIGGFFTRLEASRKYVFGTASVYGEANDSIIQGAFIIRGQEYLPVFDVAPDWESYEFTKLDPTKEEDRKFVDEEWTWERPLVIDGKTYPHYDGKVCK